MKQPTEHKHPKHKTPNRKKNGILVVILLLIGIVIFNRHEPITTIDCTPDIIASKPDVIMLGAWWCSYCYQAKKYFQRNDIHYCEYDMENTTIGQRMYQEQGGGAVPILLIGQYRLSGFNERQIETAISLIDGNSSKEK